MNEFNSFFKNIYQDRWEALLEALQAPERQIPRKNLFSSGTYTQGELTRGPEGLLDVYIMDPASVLAAKALQVQSGDQVLDMCAAPGGKTLILIEAIKDQGSVIANEIAHDRRERLTKVIQNYIPRDVRDRVFVNGKDGGKFALTHAETFDKILVDAPCSGERYQLRHTQKINDWSEKSSKNLAQRQYALLTAALIAAKPGGRIVYSTCSISPYENDGVIERLQKKRGENFKVVSDDQTEGEKTRFGFHFLPDKLGYGPIYFSILEKL